MLFGAVAFKSGSCQACLAYPLTWLKVEWTCSTTGPRLRLTVDMREFYCMHSFCHARCKHMFRDTQDKGPSPGYATSPSRFYLVQAPGWPDAD
jgi:hypothetical protein